MHCKLTHIRARVTCGGGGNVVQRSRMGGQPKNDHQKSPFQLGGGGTRERAHEPPHSS